MSTMLNDTLGTAKNAVETARETAKNAVETAKEGTEHAVTSARSTVLDGVHAVTKLVETLRGFGVDDGLALVGLARRTSPIRDLAVFGAGIAVGAGAAMLFAPMSGADTRRAILDQFKGVKRDAKETIERAENEVEELAGKAKTAVVKAERKVENKVEEGVEALKDKAESAADAVKDKAEDAKNLIYPRGVRPAEAGTSQSGPGNGHRMS